MTTRHAAGPPAIGGPRDTTLCLLGSFVLYHAARRVSVPPVGQRLLALLAVQPAPLTRSCAAATLWPDAAYDRAAASLRSALWRLPAPGDMPLVGTGGASLWLDSHVDVDVAVVATRCVQADHATTAPRQLPEVGVLSRELLPGWDEDWLLLAREQYRQVRLHALETVCLSRCRQERWQPAMDAAMAAIATDPLRESAHRALVGVHLAESNVAEALRHYEIYRRLLHRELGLAPSDRFRRMLAPALGRPVE